MHWITRLPVSVEWITSSIDTSWSNRRERLSKLFIALGLARRRGHDLLSAVEQLESSNSLNRRPRLNDARQAPISSGTALALSNGFDGAEKRRNPVRVSYRR
jgi:hypothetical protein